jgi:hypothetical protein
MWTKLFKKKRKEDEVSTNGEAVETPLQRTYGTAQTDLIQNKFDDLTLSNGDETPPTFEEEDLTSSSVSVDNDDLPHPSYPVRPKVLNMKLTFLLHLFKRNFRVQRLHQKILQLSQQLVREKEHKEMFIEE